MSVCSTTNGAGDPLSGFSNFVSAQPQQAPTLYYLYGFGYQVPLNALSGFSNLVSTQAGVPGLGRPCVRSVQPEQA